MAIKDIYRGDTKTYKITQTDSLGAIVDVTGWEIWFTLKLNDDDLDTAAVLQVKYVIPPGADATAGIAYMVIDSTDTEVAVDKYFYDFQRVVPGSPPDVATLEKGKVKILQDITLGNV